MRWLASVPFLLATLIIGLVVFLLSRLLKLCVVTVLQVRGADLIGPTEHRAALGLTAVASWLDGRCARCGQEMFIK